MTATHNAMTLEKCLRRLAGQRVRSTELLSLFLGKQDWVQVSQIQELLATSQTLDLYWDAFLIGGTGEDQQEQPGLYLLAPDGQHYRAFEIEHPHRPLAPAESMTLEQAITQLKSAAHCLYRLHQTYITHEWGTDRLAGRTYRARGEEEWQQAQVAFADLREQAAVQPSLLHRSSLVTFTNCIQGMRIRLAQRFAENGDDPAIREDKRRVDRAWVALTEADFWLYQQLG